MSIKYRFLEDALEADFNRYIEEITDSGMPTWMADMYGHSPQQTPDIELNDDKPIIGSSSKE